MEEPSTASIADMALAIIKRNPVTTLYSGGKNLVSTTSSILTKDLAGAAPESTMNRQFPATAAAKSFPLPRPLGGRALKSLLDKYM